ncbi:unnamed protein product [Moneuplotes crassus]|uniref:Uncharacterized protein n=1 Tax=Euplotes crassus TaxID=5936 RepID=A0AAD2D839_EUPCR|nr:unnamed protein product [Moneuplotes crassus]
MKKSKSFELTRPNEWDQPISKIVKREFNNLKNEKKVKVSLLEKRRLFKMKFEEGHNALRNKLITGCYNYEVFKKKAHLKRLSSTPSTSFKLKKINSITKSQKAKKQRANNQEEKQAESFVKLRRYSNIVGGDRVAISIQNMKGWNIQIEREEQVRRHRNKFNSKNTARKSERSAKNNFKNKNRFRRISIQVSSNFKESFEPKTARNAYGSGKFKQDMNKISEMVMSNYAEGSSPTYGFGGYLGDGLRPLDEYTGETNTSHSSCSSPKLKFLNCGISKAQKKRKSKHLKKKRAHFSSKVEEMKDSKVKPSYLKVNKPNSHIIVDSIMTGLKRERMKPEEAQKKEQEYAKKLEEKALKKKVSVPVLLFRRFGLAHPDDKSSNVKARIAKIKEKALEKRFQFNTLCNKDSTKTYDPKKYKIKDMASYINNHLFTNLKASSKLKARKTQCLLKKSKTSRITHICNQREFTMANQYNMISVKNNNYSRKGTATTRTRTPSNLNRNDCRKLFSRRKITSQKSSRVRPISSFKPPKKPHKAVPSL